MVTARIVPLVFALLLPVCACAWDIGLPTGNDALLRPGGEAAFFQPTIEGTTVSGMFGCVRGAGRRFHEGIDIRSVERDRHGESVDPVLAAANGRVAFINLKPGLSNYGRYIVLEHRGEGVAVFTLYAHLRQVADDLAVGRWVQKGQPIAVMGRSSNTRERISRERAHLHFEICFLLNPDFDRWYRKRDPKAPPFGAFNGQNFVGLDPAVLLREAATNPKMNFAEYIARQPVGFTVLVPAGSLRWAELHPEQIRGGLTTNTVAYEVGVTVWGLPVALWPRTAEQVAGRNLPVLNLVNEAELMQGNCRRLVERAGAGWRLSARGRDWLELLTYRR